MLIRDFTRGKRHHQTLSKIIFQSDIAKTRDLLLEYEYIKYWREIPQYCTIQTEIEKLVELFDRCTLDITLTWTHPIIDDIVDNWFDYTWLVTIWLRINFSALINQSSNTFYQKNKYTAEKLKLFYNNHLQAVYYLDSLEDPSDVNIDPSKLSTLVPPLGKSHFCEDISDLSPSNVEHTQLIETPLEAIKREFPNVEWNPLSVPKYEYTCRDDYHFDPLRDRAMLNPLGYSIYIGCVTVLQNLWEYRQVHPENDSLYFYYVAYVDIFYYCINCEWGDMSDIVLNQYMKENPGVTIWEANTPLVDTRAFHAGDLPDLFKILSDIPLNGEQHKPTFMLAKIFQKSLPFCGQRRKLIEVTTKFNESSNAFWGIFSSVFWCCLAGMYPGDLNRPDMTKLLEIRSITDKRTAKTYLNKALFCGEYDGSALIVFTVFRKYITFMAHENVHYIEEAKKCIDWDRFVQDTEIRVNLLRANMISHDIDGTDAFKNVRGTLMQMHKTESELLVYRYKKYNVIKTLIQHCNSMLEKTIFQATQDWIIDRNILEYMHTMYIQETCSEKDIRAYASKSPIIWDVFSNKYVPLSECFERCKTKIEWFISSLESEIPIECKESLINILIKVHPNDRLANKVIQIMELPKYGGISTETTKIVQLLIDVYREYPAPRKFNELIRKLDIYDFKVLTWYLNIVNMLDKINLTVWDAQTVQRIDYAMVHKRNILFPGQTLPKNCYNIHMTLCCSRITTFKGNAYFGNKSVAFDINRGTFVCSKRQGKKSASITPDDIEQISDLVQVAQGTVDTKKYVRDKKKKFTKIPCKEQPLMCINLRGFILIYGNERDTLTRYCHCPSCGSFHVFDWLNFVGSTHAQYRCGECKSNDTTEDVVYECKYCLARPSKPITHFLALKRSLYILYPNDPHHPIKLEYFCKKHFNYAKYKVNQLPYEYLWPYIRKKEQQKRMRIAMGIFR